MVPPVSFAQLAAVLLGLCANAEDQIDEDEEVQDEELHQPPELTVVYSKPFSALPPVGAATLFRFPPSPLSYVLSIAGAAKLATLENTTENKTFAAEFESFTRSCLLPGVGSYRSTFATEPSLLCLWCSVAYARSVWRACVRSVRVRKLARPGTRTSAHACK